MRVALDIPEEVEQRLRARWSDLPRHALEALAAAAYRSGVLTGAEVGCMLGLESRWEVEDFLKNAEALLGYTEADLSRDLQAIRMTRGR